MSRETLRKVLDTDAAIADRTMPVVTRAGYTFAGWFATADFNIDSKVEALPETMPAYDVVYYASWTANAATIAFDAQGGYTIAR